MNMHTRFHSRAFRDGFVDGFTAPCDVFARTEFRRANQIDATIEGSWREVGKALSKAFESEGVMIGTRAAKKDSIAAG